MFVDSSALVSIIGDEIDARELRAKLKASKIILVSPLTIYETTTAIARLVQCPIAAAQEMVAKFAHATNAETVVVDQRIGEEALAAFERFGKGRHRAALNMGDCFAYACAKSRNVPLLFKGDDFVHTDIATA